MTKVAKPRHTPGPWRADGVCVWSEASGEYVAIPSPQMSGKTPNDEERENAKLIASAPDLLLCLKWAVELIEKAECDVPMEIHAAIKKAEGGR